MVLLKFTNLMIIHIFIDASLKVTGSIYANQAYAMELPDYICRILNIIHVEDVNSSQKLGAVM